MPKIKILVVEDESLVARDILNMLQSLGYDPVGIVSSGEQALLKAASSSPDLVLMDIVLKGELDGIAAAEKLWEDLSIPVIYLTAYADDTTFERAKLTRPFGYLLKPFEERELQTTIEMGLYKSKMEMRLREREQWLSTVLRSIGDGVVAADTGGRVTFMNPLAESLTGWGQEEALGRPLQEIISLEAPSQARIEDTGLSPLEGILAAKGGRRVPIERITTPIIDGRKDSQGRVLVFRDISERKESETTVRNSLERLRRAFEGMVQAMSMTVEMRDPYTAGHQRRVSKLSAAIATLMGMSESEIEGIRMAGDIHDIGKIYVPAEILSKPGKLTDIEYTIIKTHPRVGYDILKNIEFPWPIAEMVAQHHERLDGSGYPVGLRSDEIHPGAKIIIVADVVEAMSSHRPYRPAQGIDKAFEEISKNSGILYEAPVVEACLTLFRAKGFSFE